jgi:hypothetical protein
MVILQVFQVCDNSVDPFLHHLADDSYLIIWFGFTLFNCDGILGAVPYACTKAVAHQLGYKPYLPVNNLESTFMAVRNTHPASVALLLIYFNNISLHDCNSFLQNKGTVSQLSLL